jgi:hypothetical protein
MSKKRVVRMKNGATLEFMGPDNDTYRGQGLVGSLLVGCRFCLVGDPHPVGHWCSEVNVVADA